MRDLSRDNKGRMREVCFLKTHVFLEITQKGVRLGGEAKHESEWMRSGCREMNDKEEEGRQRQENLVLASNNLCQRGDVKQE